PPGFHLPWTGRPLHTQAASSPIREEAPGRWARNNSNGSVLMPTCSRSSQTVRPTRGMITGPASSGDRTQRRTALLATAALCAFLITAALVLLRALPHRTAVEPLSVSPDRLSLSERTSPLFFSSRAAAPQA